jgi:hypothetical protein
MKARWLIYMTVFFFLFTALVGQEQEKEKEKTNPPPKKPVATQQKPKPQQKTASMPQQKTAVQPTGSNTRMSEQGKPNTGGQGTQQRAQSQAGMRRQVSTQELHQRMSAPVTREELVRARGQYRQEEVVRYRMRAVPIVLQPRHRAVLVGLRIMPGTYYHRRAVFYDTYGFVYPAYFYDLRPSYGLWDARFLGFMLWRIAFDQQYALMYYDHMNEPEFIQWRQEMDGLAAENADLRQQLAAMDQRVSQLEGTPRNTAYVPQDAGDVALSPDVIDKLTSGPEKQ